jgi:hypothetical protein
MNMALKELNLTSTAKTSKNSSTISNSVLATGGMKKIWRL